MDPILFVLGTRPEAVKISPVLRELTRLGAPYYLYATGQHKTLTADALAEFGLTAHRTDTLPAAPLPETAGNLLRNLSRFDRGEHPPISAVAVQGDTVSAYAGALFAFLRGYPLFHIEAGLRTGEKSEPFPEEVFRRGIGTMADVHFATTTEARAHLLKEGIREENIILSGNTEADALRDLLPHAPKRQPTVLITLHRRENLSALDGILQAVRELAERFPERRFFFPVHPSPAFAEAVREHLYGVPNLTQSPPIPPTEFLGYLKSAEAVLTDSGGVSEECAILGVPTVVLRNKTEREAELRSGCVFLAGTQKDGILSVTAPILRNPAAVALPPSFPKRSPSAVIAREMLRHIKNGDP